MMWSIEYILVMGDSQNRRLVSGTLITPADAADEAIANVFHKVVVQEQLPVFGVLKIFGRQLAKV
jgi:hypothetical protein